VGQAAGFSGVLPPAELYAADVYCGLPTGGNVMVLAAALSWLAAQHVPVINVSLVGPADATLERVIARLVASGVLIVAAVGNDGPAAPPLYPAAYAGVIGVTGVDARRRVLLEAVRGPQVAFAAPGADMAAAGDDGDYIAVRGTSFAAPVVAALLADVLWKSAADAAAARVALVSAAVDLGSAGPDPIFGAGLVGERFRIAPPPLAAARIRSP
jgi:subtilisin family serine protease